jgi:DNA-binding MarR family transcriptional regulator
MPIDAVPPVERAATRANRTSRPRSMPHNADMDKAVRDGRVVAAVMVWGAENERAADRLARRLTPGLNARDVLLLGTLYIDRGGRALPGELIGPVFTTAPGVSGSLRRLERAGLVIRGVGADARTRPVELTPEARELAALLLAPWAAFCDEHLARLDEAERVTLYRLLVKASGMWDGVWPTDGFVDD